MLLNQKLRNVGHKTVHAGCVSNICQILVLDNLGHFISVGNRRLCMLNQSVSMCDLLLATGFKGPNVIASQRCDNVLEFMLRVLRNWRWRILLLLLKFIIIIIIIVVFTVFIITTTIIITVITIIIIAIIIIVINCIIYCYYLLVFKLVDFKRKIMNSFKSDFRDFSDHGSRKTFFTRTWILIKHPFIFFISFLFML